MPKLPEYFEYCKEDEGRLSGYYPFHYDVETQMFIIGGQSVAVTDFDPYRLVVHDLGFDDETDSLPYDKMFEHPLMLPGFGAPLSGPLLFEWAKKHAASSLPEIAKVIARAYKRFNPSIEIKKLVGAGTHMEFSASVDEVGKPRFQTLGSCACLSVDVMSHMIEGERKTPGVEQGFAEYDLHNADSQAQRASLFAGLGHVARLARDLNF